MHTRSLLVTTATCLVAACGGLHLTPADVAGTYGLTRIEGQVLPTELFSGTSCDYLVTSGSLDLRADTTFEIILDQVEDCRRSGGDSSIVGRLTEGTYAVAGTRLVLTAVSAETRNLEARMSGEAVIAQLPVVPGAQVTKAFTFSRGTNGQ